MPPAHANGQNGNGPASAADADRSSGFAELVTDTEQMRQQVQDVLTRLGRLLAGLKQFRRQDRAFRTAVQSLRDLRLEP